MWSCLIWLGVAILMAIPIIGFIAELFEWYKNKTINDYERGENGERK